jgi:hypothetical protein
MLWTANPKERDSLSELGLHLEENIEMVLKEIRLKNVESIHAFQDENPVRGSFEHGSKPLGSKQ